MYVGVSFKKASAGSVSYSTEKPPNRQLIVFYLHPRPTNDLAFIITYFRGAPGGTTTELLDEVARRASLFSDHGRGFFPELL
jgi:hypothetical protein